MIEDLHEVPAYEADYNHKGPAWHHRHTKQDVADRLGKAELSQPAIEWLECTFVDGDFLVCLLCVYAHNVLRRRASRVEPQGADRGRRTRLVLGEDGQLDIPNGRWARMPDRAQDRASVAVDITQVGGGGVGRKQRSRFIPGDLQPAA